MGVRGVRRSVTVERGSGSVLALSLVAATVVVALAVLSLAAGLGMRQRVIGAADSAALAAADAASGAVPGAPCAVAARVVSAARVRLVACHVDGLIVTIAVDDAFAGVTIRARSTAGPPP